MGKSQIKSNHDSSQLYSPGGYTIYWRGKPTTETHQSGVGFAIKSSIANRLEATPQGLSDRLMVLRVRLSAKRHATLISAYAPTMSYSHEAN